MDDLARLGVQYRAEGHEQVKQANRDVRSTSVDAKKAVDDLGAAQTKAAADAQGYIKANAGVTRSTQEQVDTLTGVTRAQRGAADSTKDWVQELNRQAQSFDRLRSSVDPTFAATKAYERAVEQANAAVKAGIVTQREADRVLASAKSQYMGMAQAMEAVQKGGAGNTYILRNLAYQINQIGQQGAVTGDFLGALAIQIPDILSAFGGLGLVLTGGAFALGASFLPELLKTRDGLKDVEKAIDDLADAMARLKDAQSAAATPFNELLGDYGEMAREAQALLEIEQQIALVRAERANLRASTAASSALGGDAIPDLPSSLIGDQAREAAAMLDRIREINTEAQALADLGSQRTKEQGERLAQIAAERSELEKVLSAHFEISGAVQQIADDFDVSNQAAAGMAEAFARIRDADNTEDRSRAMRELARDIFDATDGLNGASDETLALYELLLDAADGGLKVEIAAGKMEGKISDAADEAGRLYANMAAAVGLGSDYSEARVRAGIEDGSIPPWAVDNLPQTDADKALDRVMAARRAKARAEAAAAEREANRRKPGGGTRSTQDRTQASYDRLMASLDPLIAAEQKHAAAQEVVNAALDAGKISAEEAAAAMALLNKEYAEDLAAIQDDSPFGRMKDDVEDLSTSLLRASLAGQDLGEVLKNWIMDQSLQLALNGLSKSFDLLTSNIGSGSGGGFWSSVGNLLFNANGNAFSGGRVTPFAKGGVVDGPTLFPMANGAGLMGEAGPEAVMPLTRGSDGKLGVQAGGGGVKMDINITDSGGLHVIARDAAGQVLAEQRASLTQDSVKAVDSKMKSTRKFGNAR